MNIKHVSITALMIFASLGCSRPEPDAYPTELQVLVNGKPAAGAIVTLHPVGSSNPNATFPNGKADQSGTVKLSTFAQDDGAPPGDYTVTVEWREERVVTIGSDKVREFSDDKLKGKYRKAGSPTNPRITIQKQPNKLPALQL